MVSADRLPAVNRLAATLPARFPVVNCLAVVSAPDFWLSIAFAATFVRPVSGGQSFCGGFCTGFWLPIAFAVAFACPVFGCQLSCGGFRTEFWLPIAFLAISAARFWLHGFRGLPYRFCRTPVAAAVPMRSRQPRAVPGFRAVVHPNSGRVFFADCRKRCCLINLERYGRFPTQSLHYGGPDAQLHPDGLTAFHLAARRQQTHRRAGIPI